MYNTGMQGLPVTGKAIQTLLQDNGSYLYTAANMSIGPSTGTPNGAFNVISNTATTMYLDQYSTDAVPSKLYVRKSRGTLASPSDVSLSTDALFSIIPQMYRSGAWQTMGNGLEMYSDSGYLSYRFNSGYPNTGSNYEKVTIRGGGNGSCNFVINNTATALSSMDSTIHSSSIGSNAIFTVIANTSQSADSEWMSCQNPTYMRLVRFNGTAASPSDTSSGDVLGRISFGSVYSGYLYATSYVQGTQDGAIVSGVPGRLGLFTATNTGSELERMRITSLGCVAIGKDLMGTSANIDGSSDGYATLQLGSNSQSQILLETRVTSAAGSRQYFLKSRGTNASPTTVVDGDTVGLLEGRAYVTTAGFLSGAKIEMVVEGTVTSNQRAPTAIKFYTNTTNTAVTLALTLDKDQVATFASTAVTPASTTARAGFRIVAGAAPTSPVDGDIWSDGTDLKIRMGGVTKTVTLV